MRADPSRSTSPKDLGRGGAVGVTDVETGIHHSHDVLKLQVEHIVSVGF